MLRSFFFLFFLTTTLNKKFGLCQIAAPSGDISRAHLPAGAGGEQDSAGMSDTGTIIPAQRGFGVSALFPVAQNHSGFRVPFSLADYPGSWRRRAGSLGNGSCLILLSSFVCTGVSELCSRVRETSCNGGDTKGCGLFLAMSWSVVGCRACLHFKRQEMGFQNCELSYKLQGCFFIIGATALGPLLFLLSQLQTFPFSQPDWYLVKIRPKNLFSRSWVSCVNTDVLRTSHAAGNHVSDAPCLVGCITGHPNCRPSHVVGHLHVFRHLSV